MSMRRETNGKTQLPLCGFALAFEAIAKETIFSELSQSTTKKQYQQAQECLLSLRNELQRRISPFHFPSPTGFHICIGDCYVECMFRLKNLSILAPLPPKALVDAPKPRELSAEEVVNNLEGLLSQLPPEGLRLGKDTFLGERR
jgi:hypothetical protein